MEGAHNPGPTWPPAQLPSATGVFPWHGERAVTDIPL